LKGIISFAVTLLMYGSSVLVAENMCEYAKTRFCKTINFLVFPSRTVYSGIENIRYILKNDYSISSLLKHGYVSGMVARKSKLPLDQRFKNEKSGFNFYYKKGENKNEGYLLLSGADPFKNGFPRIELWDLNQQEIVYKWNLDNAINYYLDNSKMKTFYFLNPLILEDGSLVFNTQSGHDILIKIDRFGEIKNINEELDFHHSLNLGSNGNIYACFSEGDREGYAILNKDLEIIETFYIDDIYDKHNLLSRLYSSNSPDPFHINDVEPILNSKIKGKIEELVLISLRSTSSIILYNQKDKKIISIFDGMVSQQHDVDVISQNPLEISIFDNNVLNEKKSLGNKVLFLKNIKTTQNKDKTINIFMPNSKTLKSSNITKYQVDFLDLKEEQRPITKSSGLSEYNKKNNSLVIEESNFGRIFSYSLENKSINWTFLNSSKDKKNFWRMSWSRLYENNPINF